MNRQRCSGFPSFAKEGWTRPKENAAKHPLRSGRGSCFKLPPIDFRPVLTIGGLKQLFLYGCALSGLRAARPRLRQLRNGANFCMAQPPLLREGGEYSAALSIHPLQVTGRTQ